MKNFPKTIYVKKEKEENEEWLTACENLKDVTDKNETTEVGIYEFKEMKIAKNITVFE